MSPRIHGAAGIVAASGGLPALDVFAPAMVSIKAGVAETEAVSNYIERDLDPAMKNTSKFQPNKAQSLINLFYVPKPINKLDLYKDLNKDTWHFLFKF